MPEKNSKKDSGFAEPETVAQVGAQPKSLEPTTTIDQSEMNNIALERLDDDKKLIVQKLDELMDKISMPLREALDQAKNKPANTTYSSDELMQIEQAVFLQLRDLETDISTKF